ncbi:hypothetical protein SAMN05192555_102344 [Franzmannia pantelleriensis]|uniref:Cyd operon protein YbgE n=1 Tax=Franzmannia pantelleriensis TaxID=48727 RepID=A0A1G9H4A1_9GAMM|nr:cyd operon YbgE family protein [Halomonas pantelleriensis]SDL07730.1 hypothetical protein SAMN05192555_102344 [Halomonas pantelleriensis]
MPSFSTRLAGLPQAPLVAMGVSTLLALWLLWRPELLSTLAMVWRLPLIVLGVWALGAGFSLGAGLVPEHGRLRRLLGPPLCWWLLGAFSLVVLARALWGAG